MEHIEEITYIEDLEAKYQAVLKRLEVLEAMMLPPAGVKRREPVAVEHEAVAGPWQYPTITQTIIDAVCSSNGLDPAAKKLGMPKAELQKILTKSGIPHYYAEKWSISIKRVVENKPFVDNFTYPDSLYEKKDKIVKWLKADPEENTRAKAAKKAGVPLRVLQRFLSVECGI